MQIGQKKGRDINSSTMTRRIDLYVPTITADGQGGYTTTYALQETVWGDFRPMDENRALQEAQLSFTRSAKLYIRYGVTISNTYQLEVEGERYTIHSIKDVENQFRFYEILMYF